MYYLSETVLFLLLLASFLAGFILNFVIRLNELEYLKNKLEQLENEQDKNSD